MQAAVARRLSLLFPGSTLCPLLPVVSGTPAVFGFSLLVSPCRLRRRRHRQESLSARRHLLTVSTPVYLADARAVRAARASVGPWAWASSFPRPSFSPSPSSSPSGVRCFPSRPPVLAPAPKSPSLPGSPSRSVLPARELPSSRSRSVTCCWSPFAVYRAPAGRAPSCPASVVSPPGRSPSRFASPPQEMDQDLDPPDQDMDQDMGGRSPSPRSEAREPCTPPPPPAKPGRNTPLGSATRLGRNAGRSPTHILVSPPAELL